MITLLENPELVQREIDRRLAAANDTVSHDRRMAALHAESSRNASRMSRLLDAYPEGLVPLDALRARNAPLQTRQRAILPEIDALQTSQLNRESQLALATTVSHFPGRMREAARSLSVVERQRIVHLLVSRGADRQGVGDNMPLDPAERPTSPGFPVGFRAGLSQSRRPWIAVSFWFYEVVRSYNRTSKRASKSISQRSRRNEKNVATGRSSNRSDLAYACSTTLPTLWPTPPPRPPASSTSLSPEIVVNTESNFPDMTPPSLTVLRRLCKHVAGDSLSGRSLEYKSPITGE